MTLRPSRVLQRLRAGELPTVLKINLADPRVIEIAGLSGVDAVWLCNEHVPNDWIGLENQIRAARIHNVDTLVRVARGSYSDYIRPLEADATYTYMSDWALHHALIAIQTDNGQQHYAVEGQFPIGINEFCPTNDNLILWDIHGGWEQVHRPWVIDTRNGTNRPVMMTIKGEGSGHQYWGWSGQVIYSVINGGRYPQGIWAVDWPSATNERCVAIGGTHAHACASPQEDVFVQDEVFGVGLPPLSPAKYAQIFCSPSWGLFYGLEDVFEPPGGPYFFHTTPPCLPDSGIF